MKKTTTRRALFLSFVSMFLCFTMLIGTTYAWFTDTVTSGVNQIVAGNLDVELYKGTDTPVTEQTKLFQLSANQLWEPGAVVYENLTVANEGNLALKYQLSVKISNATATSAGKTLADVLKIAVVEGGFNGDREAAKALTNYRSFADFEINGTLNAGDADKTYGLVIYWAPSANDNDYNMNKGENALTIDIGVALFATQLEAEHDSFGPDYDADAPVITYEVTPATAQDYLDGKYGSTSNMKLVLTAGDYGTLYLGRPTKYAGSNTVAYCENHDATFTDAEEYKNHISDGQWHSASRYTRTINNLIIAAEAGVTVDGVEITSGHKHGSGYDYVVDANIDGSHTYYLTQKIEGLTFENIAFESQVDINTSQAETVINGVTFTGCSFTTGGTNPDNEAAIRYYNESKNGNVKNLTVENCKFTNCYQGVYTMNINGVNVSGSVFDGTGHNAIAVQGDFCDHGKVIITANEFNNIGDRIIRFNNIGAKTDITITYNKATNSGDSAKEVIKATAIASGVTATVENNIWGDGAVIVNPEFGGSADAPKNITYVSTADDLKALSAKVLTGNNGSAEGAIVVINNDIDMAGAEFSAIIAQRGDKLTVVGNGHIISNVKVVSGSGDNTTGQASMFYAFPGSTITVSDLTFENITVTADKDASGYAAVVIGYCEGTAILNNVDVVNATVTGVKSSGMLIGHLSGSLTATDCDLAGTVTLDDFTGEPNGHYAGKYIGTLAGAAILNNCTVNATVSGNLNAANIGDVYGRATAAGSLTQN